ncbi:glycosyltransferase family 2 protein [Pseudoteredinibacter isoporae]|uniref:glycosyltransferase family 2 protein n=1 Tax=Pseudoteredinibacter isoporae TaxID=570281 RepID=UPI0031099F7F
MPGVQLTASVVLYHSPLDMVVRHLQSVAKSFAHFYQSWPSSNLRFLIVDNSVNDAYWVSLEEQLSASEWPTGMSMELIKSPANKGYGHAHNQALESIPSDPSREDNQFHVVLNPDVYLAETALLESYACMREQTDVALLSPQILDNYEAVPHVAKRYPGLRILMGRYLKASIWPEQQRHYVYAEQDPTQAFDAEMAGGCFYFCRLSALQEIGGFDISYFLYFEDFDLCERLRAKSWRLRYEPSVHIRHDGGGVAGKTLQHQWYFVCSAARFYCRYGWRF